MSSYDVSDSIAAIASPPGPACRGVVRLSGPGIHLALGRCFETDAGCLESQSSATVLSGSIRVGQPIERVAAQLYYWPDSASYTRQRSAELHCTGSLPVLNEVMRTLGQLGVRQASPGEFTLRAFLAGRIDLTRAEAVLGVIDSESEREMDVALKQLAGGLGGPIESLQDRLLEILAHIEAGLDFVEDDIEFVSGEEVQATIDESVAVLQGILARIDQRSLNRHRPRVVLMGRPNAGKSRLQNALSEEAQAIVSELAGTTRDYLVNVAQVRELEVELIDTAGTLTASGERTTGVQQRAEEQADEVLSSADLKLFCVDSSKLPDAWESAEMEKSSLPGSRQIVVQTKADLESVWELHQGVRVSSETGEGLEPLRDVIAEALQTSRNSSTGEIVSSTANRCFSSLNAAKERLLAAGEECKAGYGDEIVAASLRLVLDELAVVTGKVFTDDILDRVFSRFCIGK